MGAVLHPAGARNVSSGRYEIDEKNAIIALRAILTTRGVVPEENYERLAYYLGRLPPHRTLGVYGHVIHAIANSLDDEDPQRPSLKKLAQTLSNHIDPNFNDRLDRDPVFYAAQQPLLAENLNKIATLMQHFQGL